MRTLNTAVVSFATFHTSLFPLTVAPGFQSQSCPSGNVVVTGGVFGAGGAGASAFAGGVFEVVLLAVLLLLLRCCF